MNASDGIGGVVRRPVTRVAGRSRSTIDDAIAVERALEIRVDGRPLVVTLRTPGHDPELAIGFLAGEGLVRTRADVADVHTVGAECSDQPDLAEVTLAPGVPLDWTRFERHFAATAACGLCGRAHLDSLRAGLTRVPSGAALDLDRVLSLPERVRESQAVFTETGGLHAAVLCDREVNPLVLREDVGRHNAVDKVCGWRLDKGLGSDVIGLLWVSGRAGAEIVLKAARAGIPALASVGAPSSLAIELAEAAGMTLMGFVRDGRMNLYSGS